MVFGAAIALFGLAIGIAIGGSSGVAIAAVSLGVGWILFYVGMREYKRGRRMIAENRQPGEPPPA
jgi:Flp pilus assembly protein TadB